MLIVEFAPTEYSVSEADVFVQLNITASLPASFTYDVTVTTADISATGETVPMLIIASVLPCVHTSVCLYMCLCVCISVCVYVCA